MAFPWRALKATRGPVIIIVALSINLLQVNCSPDEPIPVPLPSSINPGIGYPGLFPGLGSGFSKSLHVSANAGAGPTFPFPGIGSYPGAIGGPIPEGEDFTLPELDPSILGAFPPVGLVGPSYIPKTWLGSALSAKGDLFFPVVLFIFFIVGVWTVVQFLLALIVPLIAGKLGVDAAGLGILGGLGALKAKKLLLKRDVLTEEERRHESIDLLHHAFLQYIENVQCQYNILCHMGNAGFLNKSNAKDMIENVNSIAESDPETWEVFNSAVIKGSIDCNRLYSCASTH